MACNQLLQARSCVDIMEEETTLNINEGNRAVYSNRGIKPFRPVRRLDIKVGCCHFTLFSITVVQGRRLNSESCWKCDHFWIQPPIIWVDRPIGTHLSNPARWWQTLGALLLLLIDVVYQIKSVIVLKLTG